MAACVSCCDTGDGRVACLFADGHVRVLELRADRLAVQVLILTRTRTLTLTLTLTRTQTRIPMLIHDNTRTHTYIHMYIHTLIHRRHYGKG